MMKAMPTLILVSMLIGTLGLSLWGCEVRRERTVVVEERREPGHERDEHGDRDHSEHEGGTHVDVDVHH